MYNRFRKLLSNNGERVLFDGAMGTMLQKNGLKLGECPEALCLTAPETVTSIHKMYVDAGSQVIYANTFGANAYKLKQSGYTPQEIIYAAIDAARRAAGEERCVALDVGPIGQLLKPMGTLSFDEAYEMFREMVVSGEKAGADLIVFETLTDLGEARAALLAAKENTELPVIVTMSFEEGGRTFTGCSVSAMAATLTGLGADVIGVNCSLGPDEIYPIVAEMVKYTDLPILVKANAGLPNPDGSGYEMDAISFADKMKAFASLGVSMVGGCCGTTPEFIRELNRVYCGVKIEKPTYKQQSVVCSAMNTVIVDGVRVIGERINPTGKKRFKQALIEQDMDYILAQAVEQEDAGAHILDVNVGLPDINEPEMMEKVVTELQGITKLPLQIDSPDQEAVERGLRAFHGVAIVNSVNGEQKVLDRILPIVKKYGACVVGLTLDERGIPKTAADRIDIAKRILDEALKHGIPKEKVFIDCLTLTVSAQQSQAMETLEALEYVKKTMGLNTVLGVSNISFGLPNRPLINRTFLTMAMAKGLTLPIINPNTAEMMDAVRSFNVLNGHDVGAVSYIESMSGIQTNETRTSVKTMDIKAAIEKGMKEEVRGITKELLKEKSEMAIVNEELIPALDIVGEKFEKGTLFLPQLIQAASASCEAFELVKASIATKGNGSVSKGKILLATVKGDIHDIGKNIVKVILENYGFTVLDLGRDVPVETVVATAVREDIHLIGLSALMTTTLVSMADTIKALRDSGHPCKILVGGAVLTEEYAAKMGADYYAKDAKRSADIAKEYFA